MKMDIRRQKKAVGGYYASVAYMDAQVGVVMEALEKAGIADQDDRDIHQRPRLSSRRARLSGPRSACAIESSQVPLIISACPGKKPAVCDSLVELIDLYPTTRQPVRFPQYRSGMQGLDISATLDDPDHRRPRGGVQRRANAQGLPAAHRSSGRTSSTARTPRAASSCSTCRRIQSQYANLAEDPGHADRVAANFGSMMTERSWPKIRDNDL